MPPEQDEKWLRLEGAFEAALKVPSGQPSRWIDAASAGDPAFRLRLERMLAAHDGSGGVLDVSAHRLHAETESAGEPGAEPLEGEEVGGFKVLDRIAARGLGG